MLNDMLSGIGHLLKVVLGNVPLLRDTTVAKSTGFDRSGLNSCVIVQAVGATSGAPSSFTSDVKMQHSDTDVDGNYVDYQPAGTAASGAITTITAANTVGRKSIDLSGAKKFVRLYEVNAFVSGTSPKVSTASLIVFGGAVEKPVQADT